MDRRDVINPGGDTYVPRTQNLFRLRDSIEADPKQLAGLVARCKATRISVSPPARVFIR